MVVDGEDDGDALALEVDALGVGVEVPDCFTVSWIPAVLQAWFATTVGVGDGEAEVLLGVGVAEAAASVSSPPQPARARTAERATAPTERVRACARARGWNDMGPPGKRL